MAWLYSLCPMGVVTRGGTIDWLRHFYNPKYDKMKMFFAFICLLLPVLLAAQNYTPFRWDTKDVKFNTVQMVVTQESGGVKSKVFSGYKDAAVTIDSYDDYHPEITLSLAGYLEYTGHVEQVFFGTGGLTNLLVYTIDDPDKEIRVSFNLDKYSSKVHDIKVEAGYKKGGKKIKTLAFTLKGFAGEAKDELSE